MKLKWKLMMAVMAVVFLAAGSAWAIPVDVSYTVSGTEGNYFAEFTIGNNIDASYEKEIFLFGVVEGTHYDCPEGWTGPGIVNFSKFGSTYVYNNTYLISPRVPSGQELSGLVLKFEEYPMEIHFFAQANTSLYLYDGQYALNPNSKNPIFEGVAKQVPEPATLILFGIGLIGIFRLRRHNNE